MGAAVISTVIAGVDGRPGGRDAIALAAALAAATNARLVLAHVICHGLHPSRLNDPHADQRALRLLEDQARALGVGARFVSIVEENAAAGLARLAQDEHADVVVTGSAHRGLLGRLVLGDDARAVLDTAVCPVAVAPAGWRPDTCWPTRIAVGYDDTPQARRALEAAGNLAGALSAELRVLGVIDPHQARRGERPIVARRDTKERRISALRRLEHVIAGLAVQARAELVAGAPGEQLERLSARADLLVVGSHARGPLGRLLFGSVSGDLVRRSQCPILIVPTPAPQPLLATPAGHVGH